MKTNRHNLQHLTKYHTSTTLCIGVAMTLMVTGCQTTEPQTTSATSTSVVSQAPQAMSTPIISFGDYFQQFKQAIQAKNTTLLMPLSDLGQPSDFDSNTLNNAFNDVFHPALVSDLMATTASELEDASLPNGNQGKVYRFDEETMIDGNTMESTTLLYFQKTASGWKLVSVMIAG